MEMKCPSCDSPVAAGEKFCGECGFKLPESVAVAAPPAAPPVAVGWTPRRILRTAILVLVPLIVGAVVFRALSPSVTPPAEARIVHPAPPGQYVGLENPIPHRIEGNRIVADEAILEEGKELYEANCAPCHGDQSDGKGPIADGWFPEPADFTDSGLIAQLQESYVFWRITEGGHSPEILKGTAGGTAMPAFKDDLTEEEIWKIIIYEYVNAGVTPRTWE
ncbi:MAG: c-type cytochrome [Anaerolineae bacterium]